MYVKTQEGLVGMMKEKVKERGQDGAADDTETKGEEDMEGIEKEEETIEQQAARMLDRVRIMRVFDFTGLMEAVGEVGAVLRELESEQSRALGPLSHPGENDDRGGGDVVDDAIDEQEANAAEQREVSERGEVAADEVSHDGAEGEAAAPQADLMQGQTVPRDKQDRPMAAGRYAGKVIADSQASDLDLDLDLDLDMLSPHNPNAADDDLDMLDIPNPAHQSTATTPSSAAIPAAEPVPISVLTPNPNPTTHTQAQSRPPTTSTTPSPPSSAPTALLILAALPRLLSPLMHNNHIRGHALLVHLQRSLRHLSTAHDMCILILNSTVGGPPNTSTNNLSNNNHNATGQAQAQAQARQQKQEEGASAFSENGGLRPALGKTFAWGLDLSLLVSEVGYGSGGGGKGGRVCEVISDRFHGRVGRWCVLE